MYLRQGDEGPKVRRLQATLLGLGFPLPQYGADGIYGPETAEAVRQWKASTAAYPDLADGSYVSENQYEMLVGMSNNGGPPPPSVPPGGVPPSSDGQITARTIAITLGAAGLLAYLLN
jgi:peptidoglycan hydrolase-like protein with peptidoglycan-binding domain